MKKNLLFAILLIGLLPKGYSQDKIITMNNDTIDCKINRISHNTIFFDVTTRGVITSGKLTLNNVSNYIISVKTTPEVPKSVNTNSFERLRFGTNGGLGYLVSSSKAAEEDMVSQGFTPENAKSYYRDLKSGLYANADLIWMITPDYGAGIKYKFFDTSARTEGFVDPQDGVNLYYTTYKEHIYVNYLGAEILFQQFVGNQKSFKLNSGYSIGLASYRNEAEYLNGYYLLTGKNIGMDIGLGLEYYLTRYLSVGADLSVFYSSIHKMKVTDGSNTTTINLEKDNYENLTRLNLSLGLRVYLWNK
jgi:hypothetical protein